MYQKLLNYTVIAFCLFNLNIGFAQEPINLSVTKQELMQYQSSGDYLKDQRLVTNQAEAYLKLRLHDSIKKPLAIVFDIDETVLSNYRDMVTLSFGGTPEIIMEYICKGTDARIEPTYELYNFAKEHKVAIFFITGRPESSRMVTEKNLRAAGFTVWDELIMKPDNYHEKTVVNYKSAARRSVVNKGYDITLNIGDQDSDLKGGYADKGFKLPNPYYYLP